MNFGKRKGSKKKSDNEEGKPRRLAVRKKSKKKEKETDSEAPVAQDSGLSEAVTQKEFNAQVKEKPVEERASPTEPSYDSVDGTDQAKAIAPLEGATEKTQGGDAIEEIGSTGDVVWEDKEKAETPAAPMDRNSRPISARFSLSSLPKVNLLSNLPTGNFPSMPSIPGSKLFDVSLPSVFRLSGDGVQKVEEETEAENKEEEEDSDDELDSKRPRTVRSASQEEEFTGFYALVLQTLLHPLGRLDSVDCNPLELAAHCQRVFGVNSAEHAKLVKQELSKIPNSHLLKVTVVEAKDIKSMDANGLSDPYCLVALVNKGMSAGDSNSLQHSTSVPSDQSEAGTGKQRRKTVSAIDIEAASPGLARKQSSETSDLIPGMEGAEALFKTECQKETLHPVWNEDFNMEVLGIEGRTLLITMWDYDEETSLWSAVKGVEGGHKMAGVKNIFRHMKHGINKTGDDFIGQVVIPLTDIPAATRVEKWYKLQKGTSKHSVTGQCRLRMQFTRKDLEEGSASSRFDHYNQLAGAVHTYEAEIFFRDKKKGPWDGKLSKLSQHLLDYFAILQDIKKLGQLITHLSCMLQYVREYSSKKYLKKLVRMANIDKTSQEDGEEGSPEAVSKPEGTDETDKPESPKSEMGLEGKVPALLMDRVFREITYNIHAELVAILSPSEAEEGEPNFEDFRENNPNFMEHEISMLEDSVHEYIDMCLKNLEDGPALFPPGKPEHLESIQQLYRFQNIHTVLSMKIWPPNHRTPHEKMKDTLTAAITSDTKKWLIENLKELPQQDEPLRPAELVAVIDEVISVFSDLCVYCKTMKEYKNAFARFSVKYFSVVAKVTDNHLSKSLQDIIKRITFYLLKYKRFPENISESSIASLRLYFTVKKLVAILAENINNGDELDLLHYHKWFQEPLIYWLVTFQHEISQRVKMALEVDKEMELVHTVVKYSNSAVDVQACFAKVTQEWNSIGFEEPDSNCIAIARITEAICDGAKLYAQRIHSILEESGFYRTSPDETFDIKDKLCITLNNIEHVRVYLDNLPNLLEWEKNIQLFVKQHNDPEAGKLTMATFQRLTSRASEDVRMMSSFLERNIAEKMCREVYKYMKKVTDPAKKSKEEVLDSMMEYIDDNLGTLYKQLLPQLFPRITQALWEALIRRFARLMKIGKPPDYYEELRESLNCLEGYFHSPAIKLDDSKTKTEEFHTLVAQLEINSLSSERLMLQYCMDMSKDVRRPEESIGTISIKLASREQENGDTSLVVKVCNADDLPGMDRSGLSDPFVLVQVCPETTQYKSKIFKTQVHTQTLNPEFNETFTFSNIPPEVISLEGVTVILSIYDHDILWKDDFIGEAFVSVTTARHLEENQTVDQCPAILLTLRRPKEQEGSFKILQARSTWEKYTRQFMAQRLKAIQNQKKRTDTPKEKLSHRLRNSLYLG
ncbi:BAI1-associated protein 3 [Holothuria leucospilota]|uniref:BAI1-associated protein 3 n=1 Tax=Holothuria leucospilota TaxID=206669 RepID=A0A9Q1CDQ7_HOLLE|nr:BAI1-associated protein 3 [Holothuria leucospilota]